ncbi:MAG: dienelactone hydrolase family protein, partial [Myxococcota bacterium]
IDVYGVGRRGANKEESAALMGELTQDPSKLRARLAASLEAVAGLDGVDPARMAVIGYCFGGSCALLMARMGLSLRGAVSFHGLLKLGEPLATRPQGRMLILHGQDDPMAPPEDVGQFAAEMKRVGGDWELHAYPGVVHSFTNPAAQDPSFGTVYDEGADRRSWAAMRRFLAEVVDAADR